MPSDGLPKNLEPLAAGDPATIGPYVLAGRLGSGGMGTVYLGRSPEKGAHVAIKVIRPELAFDEATRARFRDEMENARRVASFCTAKILDHGSFENRPYMVTEYIAGTALAEHIANHGPLDSGTLHGFALGVAAALAAIHGAGLVHRDLKPANVLLSLSGPRVIDFGIARALNTATNHTQTGIVMGSPGWMAPEQLLEEKVTTAADIFAWGCLVAFAGTGTHPFGNGDAMTLGKRVLFAEPRITGLDSPLDRLVAKALAKEPERRPKAQDLLLELAGGGGDSSGAHDPNDMVSHALHQSWRPNHLPPMPPMPPQGPPHGAHQTLTGMRHAPGPAGPPQSYPPQGGQPAGMPHPPTGMPAQQARQPHGQPPPRPTAPPAGQHPGHHTGQFPTVSPQHTGPIPPASGQQGPPNHQQAPSRPQAQPYVPPVPPPPHTPLQPARRNRWLVIAGVVAVVLLIILFSTLTALGANGFSLPWKDTTSQQDDSDQSDSADAPDTPGGGAEEGDARTDGAVRFQLADYTCTTQFGDRSRLSNGQYCVFTVAARNTSGDPVRLRPEWQLLSGTGGQLVPAEEPFSEEAAATLWGTIEPDARVEGEIVFVVNQGVEPLQLVLRSRENVEGARIDLTGATEPA
ncbi:protein kinase domain-containing protein [Marinitenerispora sediminis]|uniref:Serine/threonine protein kinase n=1 Tax=Marinitenerispora sediminis TaxID=1931232 RepID=A0A368TAW4_9ACTN|nr:protein kinase [Marinitenerispora sediminis]RCV51221.1 serine/threonine protein kinase [Marinitenerispora sediminis]RCV57126.1 serine/threonine protein kinase [Marinitenerispora sediminis]RCV62145.1 serine/threonine protein kinase [Marinitenerispora sediminis]